MKGRSRLYPISIIMMAAFLAAGPANAVYAAKPNSSWVNLDGNRNWKRPARTELVLDDKRCYGIHWLALHRRPLLLYEGRRDHGHRMGKGGR